MTRFAPVIVLAALAVLPCRTGSAQDDGAVSELQRQIDELEGENRVLRQKVLWLELLQRPTARSSITATVEFPLKRGPRRQEADHLRGIQLPVRPTDSDVREYVARILAEAGRHRDVYSTEDLEIDLLKRVGPDRAQVLIEPLLCVAHLKGTFYLIEALKTLAGEQDRATILGSLTGCPDLVKVVVAKGWTADAAPILLKGLAERSPYLSTDWVEAAAAVARPEHYEDLKYQFTVGSSPFRVWKAIQQLPGMEPLDENVDAVWRGAQPDRGSWRWRQLAAVAAHYGHRDALDALAEGLTRREVPMWDAFQKLTGFGIGRQDLDRERSAQDWFALHRLRLEFDRSQMRYRTPD